MTEKNPPAELKNYLNEQIQKINSGKRLIFVDGLNWNHHITKDLIINFINQYSKGRLSENNFKEILYCFLYTKINLDIKDVLDSNSSLEKISNVSLPTKDSAIVWKYYIYRKN